MNKRLTETVKDRHAMADTARPHHTPPFYGRHTTTTRPHLLVEGEASSSSGQSSQ